MPLSRASVARLPTEKRQRFSASMHHTFHLVKERVKKQNKTKQKTATCSARYIRMIHISKKPTAPPAIPIIKGSEWWSQAGSNRRPPACKAGALPAELWPQVLVGLGGLEPPTSPLSGVRSNHLSYRPGPAAGKWLEGGLAMRWVFL